jgi:adenylate kinase
LDGNEDYLKLCRAYALVEAKKQIADAEDDEIVIVSTHACFMRTGRLLAGFDMPFLKDNVSQLITVYATVIDSCHDVWFRLQEDPQWASYVNFMEVAIWRATEIALTRMLAEYESKPYYLLCRKDPSDALHLVCRDPPVPKVYLSYPITAVQETRPQLLKRADALAGDLRKAGFVVFNPLAIKDVPETRKHAGADTFVPREEEEAAKRYLHSQTVSRDLQLIDQADMVVVYYPTDKVSPGVFTEMSHARDRRKPLYLCAFPGAPDSVSPFLGLFYTEAFPTPDEMLPRLIELYHPHPLVPKA